MSSNPPVRRPGDRVVRIARIQPERIEVRPPRKARPRVSPALILVLGFALLIFGGAALLALPISSATGEATPFLDALFTATSAVCVTGLVVVDTGAHWSAFGQALILTMIQIGGLGFMAATTLLLLVFGRRVSLRQRILVRESLGTLSLAGLEGIIVRIVLVTFILEAIGAFVLTLRFAQTYPLPTAAWFGLFHAVSAFNNAGFDIFGNFASLTPFATDPLVLLPLSALVILGGIGVYTMTDIVRARSFRRMSLDTKLIVTSYGLLLAIGAVLIYALENINPATLGALPPGPSVLNAFVHSVMPRTAGFNSLDVARLTEGTLAVTIVLMFIGGAPGSTAGGIKVTTFSVLLAAIISTVRGHTHTEAFGREVPQEFVARALTVALLAVALVMSSAILLTVTEGEPLTLTLFEAASAFATVGMTAGLTTSLTGVGKIVLIALMFAGRLGPLTLALALAQIQHPHTYRNAPEPIRIG